jgi:starch-binding outer membrane protein, SusD/RagB family
MHGEHRTAARPASWRRPAALLLTLALVLPAAACDSLLEVDDPDVLKPDQLNDASAIPTRLAGAILDFQIAFNGNFNNALTIAQGLFTDEYINSETFEDRVGVDMRIIDRNDNQIILYLYSSLHVARASAEQTIDLIEEFEPDHEDLPLLHSLQGFSEIFLAESFCSGVPISRPDGAQIVFGEPRTTSEVFDDAVVEFDAALAEDAAYHTASVGKARALLNLGRLADAAAAVANVPTSFVDFVRHSSTTPAQENALWSMATNGRISVANNEAGVGLPFRAANDPRVPWLDTGTTGFDESTPLYLQLVSPEIDSDVVLASGVEARLIEAEAALQAGDRATFFARHNAARATEDLAPLTDTGQTTAQLVDLHFRERAFWFYSTGHRLGDMRRLLRQYGRTAANVFPSGSYFKGGAYGQAVNFPIPVEEDNNPNTSPLTQGCLDRNA